MRSYIHLIMILIQRMYFGCLLPLYKIPSVTKWNREEGEVKRFHLWILPAEISTQCWMFSAGKDAETSRPYPVFVLFLWQLRCLKQWASVSLWQSVVNNSQQCWLSVNFPAVKPVSEGCSCGYAGSRGSAQSRLWRCSGISQRSHGSRHCFPGHQLNSR